MTDAPARPLHVLLAGAAGFLGSHLVRACAGEFHFTALSRNGAPIESTRTIALDLRDCIDSGALPAHVDAVVHLAQSNRYRSFPVGADEVVRVNVASTLALAEWARKTGCPHFVYASSPGFNPEHGVAAADDAPIVPESFYLKTKAMAEALLVESKFPGTLTILRPYTPYGPGQRDRLIPNLAAQVAAGKPITLEGDDRGLLLSPIHVRDAVRAIAAVLRRRPQGFVNLAGEETVSVREVAELAGAACGRSPLFEIRADTAKRSLVGDNRRMKSLLEDPTLTRFPLGLAECLAGERSSQA